MDKVSGIIPSNARIEAVDDSKSKPVRLGTPGRKPSSSSSVRLPGSSLSAMERITLSPEAMAKVDPDATRRTKIAERVTKDFFNTYDRAGSKVTELPKIIDPQKEEPVLELKPYNTPKIDIPKPIPEINVYSSEAPEVDVVAPSSILDSDPVLSNLRHKPSALNPGAAKIVMNEQEPEQEVTSNTVIEPSEGPKEDKSINIHV